MLAPEVRLAVDDLLARFVDAVARRDLDDLGMLFRTDATVEGPALPARHGRDAIVAGMAAAFATWDVMVVVPSALLVTDVAGDRIRTRWYLCELGRRDGEDAVVAGVYHDELVRDGDGWRFARRRFELLYARPPFEPAAGAFPHLDDGP